MTLTQFFYLCLKCFSRGYIDFLHVRIFAHFGEIRQIWLAFGKAAVRPGEGWVMAE